MPAIPQTVWMPGGVRTEIHLTSAETDGKFCLLVDHPPIGWSLPAHRHTDTAETIYLLEGEFEMVVEDRLERLATGQTIHIPKGVVHSGSNVGGTPARRLLTFSPGGMEKFFCEAGSSSSEIEIDRAKAATAAIRHGWEFVD